MNRFGLALAAVAFGWSSVGYAAEMTVPAQTATPITRHSGVIAPQDPAVELEIGKGTLIKLSRPATTVFVANPDTADIQIKSPSLIYVLGKTPGETVLYAVDDHDQTLYSSTVRVTANLSRLREGLKSLLPEEPIEVTSFDGTIMLTGSVSSAAHAEDARSMTQLFADETKAGRVLNRLSLPAANQVNLRVRIVEIGRSTLKELGINWNSLVKNSRFSIGLATANPVTQTANLAQNALSLGYSSSAGTIDAVIDALGQEGLVSVLAEPNLTALSGQTASFLAGGAFPIPVTETTTSGVPTITVEFKNFGVALDFTPTVLDTSRINLRVKPEVSQLTDVGAVQMNNFTVPALTIRRAETSVELGSGESFVIAGLLENDAQVDTSKIPGLGNLPVLGPLFRSDRFKRQETELAIIVTPYLVSPTKPGVLVGPSEPVAAVPAGAVAGTNAANTPTLVGRAGFALN